MSHVFLNYLWRRFLSILSLLQLSWANVRQCCLKKCHTTSYVALEETNENTGLSTKDSRCSNCKKK